MDEYYRGTTIKLTLTVRSTTSPTGLVDPDGCVLDIFGPDDEEILTGGAMSTDTTGIYYYNWTSSKDAHKGVYTARGRAEDGSPVEYSPDEYQFKLK